MEAVIREAVVAYLIGHLTFQPSDLSALVRRRLTERGLLKPNGPMRTLPSIEEVESKIDRECQMIARLLVDERFLTAGYVNPNHPRGEGSTTQGDHH